MNATLRIYDNGGKTLDRFTILPPRSAADYRGDGAKNWGAPWGWAALGASEFPYSPGGFGQHVTATPGRHLGRRIGWDALPRDVRLFCYAALPEFVPELETVARHFCVAAQWADAEEGTRPRLSREALNTARGFAAAFIAAQPRKFRAAMECDGYGKHPDAGSPAAAFGHDLYLTAAGHGVGFSDRAELGETGERLAEVIHKDWRRWHVEAYQSRGWLYLPWRGP